MLVVRQSKAVGVLKVAPIQDLTNDHAHYGALAVDLEDDLVANRVLELVGRSKLAEGSCQPALRPYARAPTREIEVTPPYGSSGLY